MERPYKFSLAFSFLCDHNDIDIDMIIYIELMSMFEIKKAPRLVGAQLGYYLKRRDYFVHESIYIFFYGTQEVFELLTYEDYNNGKMVEGCYKHPSRTTTQV